MIHLLVIGLFFSKSLAQDTTCDDFKYGCCPLDEMTIISQVEATESPSACQDLCITLNENGGACRFFTHYETTCYLLRSCDSTDQIEGCLSGPNQPDFDTCFGTTVGPASTTTEETTTMADTTTMRVTTARPTTCEDFQEGICPLVEENIIMEHGDTLSPGDCQDLCIASALTDGLCKFFTHFDTTCYLLTICENITHVPGCMSGPNLPDYDICVTTTAAPETTTAEETSVVPETTTAIVTTPEPTVTAEQTTSGDCSGFYPGLLCTPEQNIIDTITHIMTPKECQTICQLRNGCTYWSHWIEVREEHIGHCDLHYSCPHLVEDKCVTDADPKCPTIPMSIYGDADDMNNAAEEVDAPLDKKSMPPGPGSGECGCISGPAYPSIDQCDFW